MKRSIKIFLKVFFSIIILFAVAVFILLQFSPIRTGPEYAPRENQLMYLKHVKNTVEGISGLKPKGSSIESLWSQIPKDPWETPLRFMPLEDRFILTSAGPDKIFNTDDDQSIDVFLKKR